MREVTEAMGACPSCETDLGILLREKGGGIRINEAVVCGHCLAILQKTEKGFDLVDETRIPLRQLNELNRQRDAITAARRGGAA